MSSVMAANSAAMNQNARAVNAFETQCLSHKRKLLDLTGRQRDLDKDLLYNICSLMNF